MILNKQPPFWFAIHKAFPNASLEKQVFAFYPHIYSSVKLSEDIIAHENTHLRQQKSFMGACWWWVGYIVSPKFRVRMEIEAYKAQLEYVQGKYEQRFVEALKIHIAQNLSGEVYNNCVSYKEILELL